MDDKAADEFLKDNFNTYCTNSTAALNTTTRRNFYPDARRTIGGDNLPALKWSNNQAPFSTTGKYLYGVSTLSTTSSTYCKTNDNLCSTIMDRSTCDKMQTYATAAGSTQKAVQGYRPEIFYKIASECATKQELYDASPVIKQLLDATQAQLIIYYIVVIVGFLLQCIIIWRDFKGMHDSSEEDDAWQVIYHRWGYGFDFGGKVGKVICIAISFLAVAKANKVFHNADQCTDALSAGEGFAFIASTIDTVAANTVTNVILEGLLLLFVVYCAFVAKAFNDYDVDAYMAALAELDAAEEKLEQITKKIEEFPEGEEKEAAWPKLSAEMEAAEDEVERLEAKAAQIKDKGHAGTSSNEVNIEMQGAPPPPPPHRNLDWMQAFDRHSNRPYWINRHSGHTSWECPSGFQLAPPPPVGGHYGHYHRPNGYAHGGYAQRQQNIQPGAAQPVPLMHNSLGPASGPNPGFHNLGPAARPAGYAQQAPAQPAYMQPAASRYAPPPSGASPPPPPGAQPPPPPQGAPPPPPQGAPPPPSKAFDEPA